MTIRKLLVSGDRRNFTTLQFNTDKEELSVLASYAAPDNASWVELSSSRDGVDHLIGLSEGDESGLLYTFNIDHKKQCCKITSQQTTLGAPAHFITLRGGSAVALATYFGGSVALYPISPMSQDGVFFANATRTEVQPCFPYKSQGYGPNQGRQRQCHVHQVLETSNGLLYAPDLGSDRVWILRREGMKLDICGWLQCPHGSGPRHAVVTPDESVMYVIGELSHIVMAFRLRFAPAEGILPIDGFAPNVISPMIDQNHQNMMDAAEICVHPTIPNVLYVSNRWARHIAQREPHLANVPEELPSGDDVGIIMLSEDGTKVKNIKHVRTGLDVIRGMRLSDDGRYVVVVGQEGGGVAVYEIGGKQGDEWTLVTALNAGLESGLKHAIWL